jgi:dCTP deaminase
MIMPDYVIAELARTGLVTPFDETLINPASIDIRIGTHAVIEREYGRQEKIEIGSGLLVRPGAFILTETSETFKVPNGYALDLRLKSTIARMGWNHNLAVWCDPGFKGVLTLEISNVTQYTDLVLKPGMRFAQAIVLKMIAPPVKPYEGKYQNAKSVELAK